jgi:GTP cyclohydrolase I
MHHPRHDQAAEYRRQAQEIRTMVRKLSIDEAREQLLETAERLERLAKEEERKALGLIRENRALTRKD